MSSNGVREVLYDKLIKESNEKKIRLNVVSYDCTDMDTIGYLRRLATNSYGVGRFHGYCFLRQYDDYIPGPIDRTPTKNKVFVNKRTFGGGMLHSKLNFYFWNFCFSHYLFTKIC